MANHVTVSEDGKEMTILFSDGHFATLRSARPNGFTPEDMTLAHDMPANQTMLPGQVNRMRSFKLRQRTIYASFNTGPPTWWYPRVEIRNKRIMVGWFRALAAVAIT